MTTKGRIERGNGTRGRAASAQSVAFLLLAGVVVGAGIGFGVDYLIHGFPIVTIVGVFAGFALALYAVYLETR